VSDLLSFILLLVNILVCNHYCWIMVLKNTIILYTMVILVRLPRKKQFHHEQHLLTVYGKSCNICCWRRNPVQRKQALYFVVLCCEVKLRTIFDCFYQKVTNNNRCSWINKVQHLLLDVFCQFKRIKFCVIMGLIEKLIIYERHGTILNTMLFMSREEKSIRTKIIRIIGV